MNGMNDAVATTEKSTRYIARCKACACATSGLTSGQNPRRAKSDPLRTGAVYTHANGSLVLDCRKCGGARYANPVRGKFSAKHVCSAKCISSTGTICECSCGGKNHGGAFGS